MGIQSNINQAIGMLGIGQRIVQENKANMLRQQQTALAFQEQKQDIQNQLDQAIAELAFNEAQTAESIANIDKRTIAGRQEKAYQKISMEADELRQKMGNDLNYSDLVNVYSKAAKSLGSERVNRGLQRELFKSRIKNLQQKKIALESTFGGTK